PVLQRRPGLIRTNCCSPCLNQNRCRWNQRPNVPLITGPAPFVSPQPVHPPDLPRPANSASATTSYPTLVTTTINTISESATQPITASSGGDPNPCRYGVPALGYNQNKLICGPVDSSQCPKGHYCHIGENPATTACCEGSGFSNRCLLSVNEGEGNSLIERFYYDVNEKRCKKFIYNGIRGNENNFLTMKECEDECTKQLNVCLLPLINGERKECNRDDQCASGQWCHLGSSRLTSVCCRGAVSNPCILPLETGDGSENITRWFSDPSDNSCNRRCTSFVYKGSKGNQNNFLSKEQCEKRCKPKCTNVCGNNSVLLDLSGKARRCGPSSPCPNEYWCHIGGDNESTLCCSGTGDICKQPLARGVGEYHLTRWHFSSADNKCISFIYRGTGGNQNMFLTLDDCRISCPSYENPCGSGEPLMVNDRPKLCSPDSRCPSTHFCHIGAVDAPNYCCPKDGDPCGLPLAEGSGGLFISRYYFDKETRQCYEFIYRGQKGNANNFLTKEDCEIFCPVTPNPCTNGEPLLNSDKQPVICGGNDTCPRGYYCHVGGSPETTNCCPGSRRACDKPLEVGKGKERLERWYFDGGVQLCKKFIYRGIKGNANNFISRAACQEECKEMNPCSEGNPLVDSNGERMLCTGGHRIASCPSTHYCHVGASSLTTLCCKRKDVDPCDQERSVGYGGEELPRWYFDSSRGKCSQFHYGGMGGNENNFISKHTCEQVCPEHRNYCPHGQPLFDPKGHDPVSCGIDKACPTGFICHVSVEYNVSICCQDPADFCLQPRDPGPCDQFEKRYGYHPLSDTCVEYDYGGKIA
uniref:BPTI/Kunitz inhibitor domain-containing protein n=1 Tax=Parascaris univalens TaxID=6257 RepID=A0A915A820_PARUN